MKRYSFYLILVIVTAFAATCAFAQGDETKTGAKAGDAQGIAAQQAVQTPVSAVTPQAPVSAAAPQAAVPAPVVMPAKEETPKMTELSIYGEVQSVNAQANSMTVQYYDYDNDEEKSTEITLDSASKLENAKAIGDVKKGDWVDVAYTAGAGKNIAKTVSVEKEEPVQEENAPAAEE